MQKKFSYVNTIDYILNVVLKMLIYPFVAMAVVMPLLWTGFMYDPMQSFVAMLQIASPSAITLSIITNIHKFLEKETSRCYIYQYTVKSEILNIIINLTKITLMLLRIKNFNYYLKFNIDFLNKIFIF